jgi:hypothetical protein
MGGKETHKKERKEKTQGSELEWWELHFFFPLPSAL